MLFMEARVVDENHVQLTEPIRAPAGARVFVCLAKHQDPAEEQSAWHEFSLNSLASAYGHSEPEYSLDMIKEPNPEYSE